MLSSTLSTFLGHILVDYKQQFCSFYEFNLSKVSCDSESVCVPVKSGSIAKGTWPLLISNMYWIQFLGVHWLASLPHSRLRALTLVEGAWTSLQALNMAAERHTGFNSKQEQTTECFEVLIWPAFNTGQIIKITNNNNNIYQ